MSYIKVLVVDDSAFMRKMISDMINDTKGMSVIDTARNGEDALKKVKQLKPDVVTLDVEMPIMDGITCLKRIMDEHPVPVIMLSSLTTKGAKSTIHAMEHGAIDFISKPSGAISLDIEEVKFELIQKIRMAVTANVSRKTLSVKQAQNEKKATVLHTPSFIHKQTVVAIGVSTGGPRALQQVLTSINQNFNAPILIVQHMPKRFTKTLAERLNKLSPIQVKEAQDGELLSANTAYIAPGDYHMRLKTIGSSMAIALDQNEPEKGHRPSVNVLFRSMAKIKKINKVAVVLTGMGSDGTDGAKLLKEIDPSSIIVAESKETAIINGMPKSIIDKVGANYIVPIDEMAETLNRIVHE